MPLPVIGASVRAVGTRDPAPRIDVSACTACAQCVVVCPSAAVAITFLGDGGWVPTIDNGRCTRCFDCEAACPERAIEVPFEIVEEELALSGAHRACVKAPRVET